MGMLTIEQMVAEFFNVEVQANQGAMELLSHKLDHARLVHFR